jgi:NAD(P)-dependent dehydrogenase (short-subunit alcohol dehydrogenase family)
MIGLQDCIALVTGATGGIGREIVKAMKSAGATVIATDLNEGGDHGGADHYFAHDVTNPDDWDEIGAFISETYGRLDALVNNAGISIVTKIEDTPLAEWHKVNAVNVDAVVLSVQSLLPLLKEGGKARAAGASIINFSSVGGLRGAAFNAAYCTSKAAVKMLTKCMGAEFAALGYNIRVNSVHPGGIETPMLGSIMQRYVDIGAVPSVDVASQGVIANHPIGRLGRPEEMAGGVVFLASDASSFMTCDELVMDGGFSQV